MTEVAPVGELGDVFPHVLPRNVNMRPQHGAFEVAPMPFDRIGMMDAANPFLV